MSGFRLRPPTQNSVSAKCGLAGLLQFFPCAPSASSQITLSTIYPFYLTNICRMVPPFSPFTAEQRSVSLSSISLNKLSQLPSHLWAISAQPDRLLLHNRLLSVLLHCDTHRRGLHHSVAHIQVHALPNTLSMFWQSRPSDITVARSQESLQFETTSITFARAPPSLHAIGTKHSCKNYGDFAHWLGSNPERPQVRTDSFVLAYRLAGFLVTLNSLFA